MTVLDRKLSRRRFVQTTVAAGVALYLSDNIIERVDAMSSYGVPTPDPPGFDPEELMERPFQIALDRSMIPLSWRVSLHPDDRFYGVTPFGNTGGYWTSFLGPNGEEFKAVFDQRYAVDRSFVRKDVITPADAGILKDPIMAVIRQEMGLPGAEVERINVEDVQIVRRGPAGNIISGMYDGDVVLRAANEDATAYQARDISDLTGVRSDFWADGGPVSAPNEVKNELIRGIRLQGEFDYSQESDYDADW